MANIDPSCSSITAVLVSYNSTRVLAAALDSISALEHIIVVDNGSSDGSAALARRHCPRARVIEAGANLGFGRANNLALEAVQTEHALLLNPDCEMQAGAFTALIEASRRYPEAAIWGPKIYDAPGVLGLCYRPAFHKPQPRELIDPQGDLCTEFLTGAAMLLNMRLIRQVGFFDPWFFLYLEDDDLCERARRAGHPLILVNDAHSLHRVRQSSAASMRLSYRRAYCMTLSKFYMQHKYFGALSSAGTMLRVGVGSLLSLPFYMLTLQFERVARSAARLAASLAAPVRVRAERCLPRPPR
jgi:N-acetylglucosaminyl-diphospho-decaprenol L-rhamnosyltransferase